MTRKRKLGKRRPLWTNGSGVKCHWCGVICTHTKDNTARGATRDHIYPKSRAFIEMPRVWACRACNEVKSNLTPEEWQMFRRQFPEYRSLYGDPWLGEVRAKFLEAYTPQEPPAHD